VDSDFFAGAGLESDDEEEAAPESLNGEGVDDVSPALDSVDLLPSDAGAGFTPLFA